MHVRILFNIYTIHHIPAVKSDEIIIDANKSLKTAGLINLFNPCFSAVEKNNSRNPRHMVLGPMYVQEVSGVA